MQSVVPFPSFSLAPASKVTIKQDSAFPFGSSIMTEKTEITMIKFLDKTDYKRFSPAISHLQFQDWVNQWELNNPFSAMTVRTLQADFIGYTVLDALGEDGVGQLKIEMAPDAWQAYGKEVVEAMLFSLVPLLKKKYLIQGKRLEALLLVMNPEHIDHVPAKALDGFCEIEKDGVKKQIFRLNLTK